VFLTELSVASPVRDLADRMQLGLRLGARVLLRNVCFAERLGREPRQVIDVGGNPVREQLLEDGIRKRLGVEQLLEPMQASVASGVFIEGFARAPVLGGSRRPK
jgi:hypothetical protein